MLPAGCLSSSLEGNLSYEQVGFSIPNKAQSKAAFGKN